MVAKIYWWSFHGNTGGGSLVLIEGKISRKWPRFKFREIFLKIFVNFEIFSRLLGFFSRFFYDFLRFFETFFWDFWDFFFRFFLGFLKISLKNVTKIFSSYFPLGQQRAQSNFDSFYFLSSIFWDFFFMELKISKKRGWKWEPILLFQICRIRFLDAICEFSDHQKQGSRSSGFF